MTDKTDDIRSIQNIENKYGLVLFRMGLSHVMDVGWSNIDDEAVEECIKQIMAQGEKDKADGKVTFMTPEFQCNILRCAAELARLSPWTLFAYIKKHVVIGAENETEKPEAGNCPICGSDDLEYDGFLVEDSDGIYKWECSQCGAYGREYYDMTFSESIVDGGGGE
jgi:Zn finger protein HypA/HybF involved in hydrogenase expression